MNKHQSFIFSLLALTTTLSYAGKKQLPKTYIVTGPFGGYYCQENSRKKNNDIPLRTLKKDNKKKNQTSKKESQQPEDCTIL